MGIMAYSLSWVMQDLYHQPQPGLGAQCSGLGGFTFKAVKGYPGPQETYLFRVH